MTAAAERNMAEQNMARIFKVFPEAKGLPRRVERRVTEESEEMVGVQIATPKGLLTCLIPDIGVPISEAILDAYRTK